MGFVVASSVTCGLLRGDPRPARVVAVLDAAVYLEVPFRPRDGATGDSGSGGSRSGEPAVAWVALLARDAVRVPIGLVTALPSQRRPFAAVTAGDEAVIGGGELALPGRRADGGGAVHRPLRYWDPTVPRFGAALATASAARRAEALAQPAAVLPHVETDPWGALVEALEAALGAPIPDPRRLAEAVGALAGLGPGLTPAGDDVLAGALVTLAASGDGARRAALARAVEGVAGRTTPLSAALLAQAAAGRAVPQVGDVLRAVAGSGDLDAVIARLGRVGHTSGAALALGMRAALRATTGRALRRCA